MQEKNNFIDQKVLKGRNFKRFEIVGDHFVVAEGVIFANIPLVHEFDYENEVNKENLELNIVRNTNL